jgi:hypothetical protein
MAEDPITETTETAEKACIAIMGLGRMKALIESPYLRQWGRI